MKKTLRLLVIGILFMTTEIVAQRSKLVYTDSIVFDSSHIANSITIYKKGEAVLSYNSNESVVKFNNKKIKWAHNPSFSVFKINSNKPVTQGIKYSLYYVGFFADGTIFDNSFTSKYLLEVDMKSNYLLKSFSSAIKYFNLNEIGLIKIEPKYAYGSEQAGNIPPNSTLYYLIQITDVK